ncbi:MAG: AEC family transporter [Gammaproteobacteria bacterium]|nr:AEC family transporter [Gammaproteobacteria bacterium]
MLSTLLQLLPIFVFLGLGMVLRARGLADRSQGDFLLRFVFFVTLPALVVITVATITFTPERALLPLLNISVNALCYGAALLLLKTNSLDRASAGSIAVGTLIVNNAVMFPFVLALYGEAGFADAILWDFGNAVMTATFTYATALHYGGLHGEFRAMARRVFASPLIWALLLAATLAATGTALPVAAQAILDPLGKMTAPLILVALGIHTTWNIHRPALAVKMVAIRMAFGLCCGVALALLFGLDGTTFKVVVLCSAAPIGFMALAFSSLARLDSELMSAAVSLSILAGVCLIPLLAMALEWWR